MRLEGSSAEVIFDLSKYNMFVESIHYNGIAFMDEQSTMEIIIRSKNDQGFADLRKDYDDFAQVMKSTHPAVVDLREKMFTILGLTQ